MGPQPNQSQKKIPTLCLCNKSRYDQIISPAGTGHQHRAALTFPGHQPASAAPALDLRV